MAEKKKVRVTIGGISYSLLTDETAEYTNEIAEEIDSHMKELMGSNPFISSNQAAVLLAIEYVDKAKKAEQLAESYRSQIRDYLKDASEAQSERDFYKRELDRLRTEEKEASNQINLFSAPSEATVLLTADAEDSQETEAAEQARSAKAEAEQAKSEKAAKAAGTANEKD